MENVLSIRTSYNNCHAKGNGGRNFLLEAVLGKAVSDSAAE
jgi:hypothetical protein